MLDTLLEKIKELFTSRLFPITLIYGALVFLLISRLFSLQIVQGETYEQQYTSTTQRQTDVSATRGNIYDVKGKLLAYNEIAYAVTLLDTGEVSSSEDWNAMIYKIIQILEDNGSSIELEFGLTMDSKGNVTFTNSKEGTLDYENDSILRFKRDVYSKMKTSDLSEEQKRATAEEVFAYLRYAKSSSSLRFNISDKYSKQDAFEIMKVRYAMYLNSSTRYEPVTIATNVSEKTVAAVKEHSGDIPGLDIATETIRKYDPDTAVSMAHILGYTGSISDETWSEMKKDGRDKVYSKSDQIGRTGIEKEFEDYLHGEKGYENVLLNTARRVVEVTDSKDPVAGNDIYLTIDSELQNAAYTLLEKEIATILLSKIHNSSSKTMIENGKSVIATPIYEVYFALLENNIIRVSDFSAEDASELEQTVYNKFKSEQEKIFTELEKILDYSNYKSYNTLSDDYKEYVDYIYSMLTKLGVIEKNKIDTQDSVYQQYQNKEISLSEFLQYALSQDWVNRELFSDPNEYYDSKELYDKFVEYILYECLADKSDYTFSYKIYKSLLYSGKITGKEICLLLFDQNVLKYDKDAVNSLQRGSTSPYSFIRSKIKSLEITPGQLGLEPCSGSIVITDTKTGKVKAMVSYPGYDNNKLANKMDVEYYNNLTINTSYPMINRPLQQKTAPGSTYKMVTAITGLEEGKITPSTTVVDSGPFQNDYFNGHGPKCWIYPRSHGALDVAHALEVSCNVFFYQVGWSLSQVNGKYTPSVGLEKIKTYAEKFGFSELSGIEIPTADYYLPKISDEDAVRSAIGQGTNNFTPANLSKYVTGVANSGKVYDLSIMSKIVDVNGNVVKTFESTVYNDELTSAKTSTWNAVHEGMRLVVNGSNSSIKSLFADLREMNIEVAGKTGTAQESKTKPNHALFVSYAPFNDPEITVTTVIPNGYTSSNAAELTSNVYRYYFNESGRQALLDMPVGTKAGISAVAD